MRQFGPSESQSVRKRFELLALWPFAAAMVAMIAWSVWRDNWVLIGLGLFSVAFCGAIQFDPDFSILAEWSERAPSDEVEDALSDEGRDQAALGRNLNLFAQMVSFAAAVVAFDLTGILRTSFVAYLSIWAVVVFGLYAAVERGVQKSYPVD